MRKWRRNPAVATVVRLLAIYNIPKVAINDGIPNLNVMKPFINPMIIPIDKPRAIENHILKPW